MISYDSPVFSKCKGINKLKVSTNGVNYEYVENDKQNIDSLFEKIISLEVSEVRERLSNQQSKYLNFSNESMGDLFFVCISYDKDLDLYLIDGDFLPKAEVDPTRSFKILDTQKAKEVLELCDSFFRRT